MEGLKGLQYFDNVDGVDFKTEESDAVRFTGETDRVYRNAPETVTVRHQNSLLPSLACAPGIQNFKFLFKWCTQVCVCSYHAAAICHVGGVDSGIERGRENVIAFCNRHVGGCCVSFVGDRWL